MNTKYIDETYDLSIFVDKAGRIVDWHYGTDYEDEDEGYWDKELQPENGNTDIFKDAIRAIEKGCEELPTIYLSTTVQEKTNAEGPVLLLIEWPIVDSGYDTPGHLFSVHTDNSGELVPPLPPILAERFAKAIMKRNN